MSKLSNKYKSEFKDTGYMYLPKGQKVCHIAPTLRDAQLAVIESLGYTGIVANARNIDDATVQRYFDSALVDARHTASIVEVSLDIYCYARPGPKEPVMPFAKFPG